MKLLVVEDDRLVGPAVQAVLERAGHDVVGVATTAAKALRLARHNRPDLALVDLRLGKDSGIDAAGQLKDECAVPSLVMTGFDVRPTEIREVAIGVLRKPFAPHVLVEAMEAVQVVLDGREPEQVPRALELVPGP